MNKLLNCNKETIKDIKKQMDKLILMLYIIVNIFLQY